jgi:hypothetical protein
LLQAMLQHFRHIHAAKRGLRGAAAVAYVIYLSHFKGLMAMPPGAPIAACCTYAAAKAQHNPEMKTDTKRGAHFRGRP